MTVAISFGWWWLPMAFTVAVFVYAHTKAAAGSRDAGGMFDVSPLVFMAAYLMALTASLAAWLIWSVLA
jgi:hypothetical protein